MARPPKNGAMRMDKDIRIPVTAEQKALIAEATHDVPEGMASWVRAAVLDAAKRKIAKSGAGKKGT